MRQRGAGLGQSQTGLAQPPQCLIRLFLILEVWNRASPVPAVRGNQALWRVRCALELSTDGKEHVLTRVDQNNALFSLFLAIGSPILLR